MKYLSIISKSVMLVAAPILIAFNLFSVNISGAGNFKDVSKSAWYYDYVNFVKQNKIMNGVGRSKFAPNDEATRAMIVTMLYRLENKPKILKASNNVFSDVKKGDWYYDAICWGSTNKIINGYKGGLFKPNDKISRQDLAKILYNYASYKKYDIDSMKDIYCYKDADDISDYAKKSMRWANKKGFISGLDDRKLSPKSYANRAQIATIFTRFYKSDVLSKGKNKDRWELFSDDFYRLYARQSDKIIIMKQLQDMDYDEIEKQLVDIEKVKVMTEKELKDIEDDEDSVRVDNITKDGYALKEDYEELKDKLIKQRSRIMFLDSDDKLEKVYANIGDKRFVFANVNTKAGKKLVPLKIDGFEQFSRYDDKLLYVDEFNGLYEMDEKTRKIKTLYKLDKSKYDELVKKSAKQFGDSYLTVVCAINPNVNNGKIAYSSNRENVVKNKEEIYLLDMKTLKQTKLTKNPNNAYTAMGWLDNNHLFCSKSVENAPNKYVIMDMNGNEKEVKFRTKSAYFSHIENGMIFYKSEVNDENEPQTVYVDKYNGKDFERYAQFTADTFRIHNDVSFRKDKIAYVYSNIDKNKNANDEQRYLAIYDINTGKTKKIDSLPKGEEGVSLYWWLDDNTMLVVTYSDYGKNKEKDRYRTWICHIW